MTTSTAYVPENLEEIIANAGPHTTVFADGSTFDYVHGYRSNGAPPAVNGLVNTKIVKSFRIFTEQTVIMILALLLGALVIVGIVSLIMNVSEWNHAKETITKGINDSGRVQVVKMEDNNVIVKDVSTGNFYTCGLDTVKTDDGPQALVFCGSGSPATFTIPLDKH